MLYSIHEVGQGLVEYAFLLILIAFVVMVVLLIFGPTVGNIFSNLNSQLVSLIE
jgi:pilus assembly protein Flp/PilA